MSELGARQALHTEASNLDLYRVNLVNPVNWIVCTRSLTQSAVAATTTPAGLPGWGPRFALPAHSKTAQVTRFFGSPRTKASILSIS